ncbi:MAG: DUF5666 domain-containing protein [Acidobacteriia bacterium]|nr:DUF5666 domain-containing protein [Terriglobia bacterium]
MRRILFSTLAAALMLLAAAPARSAQDNSQAPPPPAGSRERGPQGPRAFGTITSVGVDRFAIKKLDGSTQTILVNDQTRYQEGQQKIQLEDLKPGDHTMVRGRMDDDKQFVAVQVRRVSDEEIQRFQNAGERAFGQILSIDKDQIKVRNPWQGDKTIVVNDQTQFMKDGQPIGLKDLKAGDRIFALGKETQGQFVATRVVTGQLRRQGARRDGEEP